MVVADGGGGGWWWPVRVVVVDGGGGWWKLDVGGVYVDKRLFCNLISYLSICIFFKQGYFCHFKKVNRKS
jgi:hypothetical protein